MNSSVDYNLTLSVGRRCDLRRLGAKGFARFVALGFNALAVALWLWADLMSPSASFSSWTVQVAAVSGLEYFVGIDGLGYCWSFCRR
jgi:hypothetical protein